MDRQQQAIAASLSATCNVPQQFAELVIRSAPENAPLDVQKEIYEKRIQFLDKVLSMDNSSLDESSEFSAQCLCLSKNMPLEIARLIIKSEFDVNIPDEDLVPLRNERADFLLKVFSFILNH